MKKVLVIFFTFLFFLGMSACGQSTEKQWQEQYDLGVRYLSEGNYQEAILAFEMAIEIDPKRPEAYVKAAETHELMGDPAAASAVLERGFIATGDESLNREGTPESESSLQQSLYDDAHSEDVPPSNQFEITTSETITTYGVIERNNAAFPDYRLRLSAEHTIILDDPYVGKEVFECEYLYFYNDAELNGGYPFEDLVGKNCEVTASLEHYRGGGSLFLLDPLISIIDADSFSEASSEAVSGAGQLSPEELLGLLEGYWTLEDPNIPVDPNRPLDLRYGGMEFFTIYLQDGSVKYGVGVWNTGRGRMGGIVSDVWQHGDGIYSFTVNFPAVPPTLMDSEGMPATSYDVWIDMGAADDNRLLMKPGVDAEYREHFYMNPPVDLW